MKTRKAFVWTLVAAALAAGGWGGWRVWSVWRSWKGEPEAVECGGAFARENGFAPSPDEPPERRFGVIGHLQQPEAAQAMEAWVRAHPERPEYFWLWVRVMLEGRADTWRLPDPDVRPSRILSNDPQKIAAYVAMEELAAGQYPDNGWSDLLAAIRLADAGVVYVSAKLPDPKNPEQSKEVDRAVALDPSMAAAAARRLHEAVRKPEFSMRMGPLLTQWMQWRGNPETLRDGLCAAGAMACIRLPHLSKLRSLARLLAGEAERRALAIQPEPWIVETPIFSRTDIAADPEPPRPPLGERDTDLARSWSDWRRRMVDIHRQYGGHPVLPPPLHGPDPAESDSLTAFDIFHDMQTWGARQIIDDPTLVGILVGQAILFTAAAEGRRVLEAAGRPEEAEQLIARGRRLLWPRLLANVARHLHGERLYGQDPDLKLAEYIASDPLFRDPELWAEAEQRAAAPESGLSPEELEQLIIIEGRGGRLGQLVVPPLHRFVPPGTLVTRAAEFVPIRRAEYYAFMGGLFLPAALAGLGLFLAAGAGRILFVRLSRAAPSGAICLVAGLAAMATGLALWGLIHYFRAASDVFYQMTVLYREWIWAAAAALAATAAWLVFRWSRARGIMREAVMAPEEKETFPGGAYPAPRRVLAAGLMVFAASWLLPVILAEAPGTPAHGANGFFVALGLISSCYLLGAADNPWAVLCPPLESDVWLAFWFVWGLLLASWLLSVVAGYRTLVSRNAVEDPQAKPKALSARLRRGWLPCLLIASLAALLLSLYGRASPEGAWRPNAWTWATAAFLLLAAAAAAVRLGRLSGRRHPEARRLCAGAAACGALLWLAAGAVWWGYGERYWMARDRLVLPRADGSILHFTRREGEAIAYHHRETAKRLAELPPPPR